MTKNAIGGIDGFESPKVPRKAYSFDGHYFANHHQSDPTRDRENRDTNDREMKTIPLTDPQRLFVTHLDAFAKTWAQLLRPARCNGCCPTEELIRSPNSLHELIKICAAESNCGKCTSRV